MVEKILEEKRAGGTQQKNPHQTNPAWKRCSKNNWLCYAPTWAQLTKVWWPQNAVCKISAGPQMVALVNGLILNLFLNGWCIINLCFCLPLNLVGFTCRKKI